MEMTIKQLADELGVCKQTISNAILQLNFQDTLHKVGNKYILSETQISQIKLQIKTEKSPKMSKSPKTPKSPNETEKSTILLLESQNGILREQLAILNTQLMIKDDQIRLLQEQIGQLTAAIENLTIALSTEQALHAGTIQKQFAEHSVMNQPSDEEQPRQKQWIFSRLFGRK